MSNWKKVSADIEADGLLDTVTRCHSLVIIDRESKEVLSCCQDEMGRVPIDTRTGKHYKPLTEGYRVLLDAAVVYIHNGVGYDHPALKKLHPEMDWSRLRHTIIDTNVWVQLLNPRPYRKQLDRALVAKKKFPEQLLGKHTLEAWGWRLGVHKGSFGSVAKTKVDKEKVFEKWSQEMQEYCEQDVWVLDALVTYLETVWAQMGGWGESLDTEMRLSWYLRAQEQNGWPFDMDRALILSAKLKDRRQKLQEQLVQEFGSWYKPDGPEQAIKANKKAKDPERAIRRKSSVPEKFWHSSWDGKASYFPDTTHQKLKLIRFNPGSRQHIAKRLQERFNWRPTAWTPGGQPEVSESSLEPQKDIPAVKLVLEYLLIEKRLGALVGEKKTAKQAWLKHARVNGYRGGVITGLFHVHGAIEQCGTITHRGAHFSPNMSQVPSVDQDKDGHLIYEALWGTECRELFHVPEVLHGVEWIQVGIDVSGLELRELGHYMAKYDGGAYVLVVVDGKNEDGTDIHSVNRNALGLEGKPGRAKAKTFIYAFIYGGGDLKLGIIIEVSAEDIERYKKKGDMWRKAKAKLQKMEKPTDDYYVACALKGAEARAKFLKNTKGLKELIETVKDTAKTKKYLRLHDGRRVYIRSAHSALNMLLQGSGAVVCKKWIVNFAARLEAEFGPQGWDGKWAGLGWIHDELQIACWKSIKDRVMEIGLEEIRKLTDHFKMRAPLDGEAKSGRNWAMCH